jgi:hypothetical protein
MTSSPSRRLLQQPASALSAFVPEAFRYYLPSVLTLTIGGLKGLIAAESLISILDRMPVPHYWDNFLTSRLLGLEPKEYEAIRQWLLSLSGTEDGHLEDQLVRAYETVDLLEAETERRKTEALSVDRKR